jgi:hypothetical protein
MLIDKVMTKEITLPCGRKTIISKQDEWIIKEFPVWIITGSKSKYVSVERAIETEYSMVRERIYLHRLIVFGKDLKKSKHMVDHINRNRLDNRRDNLRMCTPNQNAANNPSHKKKYKGVVDVRKRNLKKGFAAYIGTNGNNKNLGYYLTAEEAALAYDREAKKLWGEFAWLNFPEKK